MFKQGLVGYRRVLKEGSFDLLYGLIMKGIESFLILYLTGSLLFSDQEAFDFLGSKSVIYYSIPFLMAFASKNLFSVTGTVTIGLFYMSIGSFLLFLEGPLCLAIGIGFLTCGYGIGRPAIPLMISEKTRTTQNEKNKDMQYLYAFGNIASIIGPIFLALLGYYTNWKTVFLVLSGISLIGALSLYFFYPKPQPSLNDSQAFSYKKSLLIVVVPFILAMVVHFQLLKWFLTGPTALFALLYLRKCYINASRHTQLIFQRLSLLGPSIIVFFIFQSQEFFLMPLYIERFVEKDFGFILIQTPWFHSISSLVALTCTPLLIHIKSKFQLKGQKVSLKNQVFMAFGCLTIQYFLISLSTHCGPFAAFFISVAYICAGIGILLLVPTAYQYILRIKEDSLKRILIGSLYLMMMFAYLGTTLISQISASQSQTHTLVDYQIIFYTLTGVICAILGTSIFISKCLFLNKTQNGT